MEYRSSYFLFSWMLLGGLSSLSSAHPRVVDDLRGNHTADALLKLMELFGIERNLQHPRHHPHPPQYMLDLYRTFTEGPYDDGKTLKMHHGANTVRSFYEKVSSGDHYQFDLSNGLTNEEEIVEAQFHFFTNRNIPRSYQSSNVIQVRLYDGSLNSSFSLIEARLVSAYVPGWEVFKVTHSVKRWILDEKFNKGLTVQVLDGPGQEYQSRQRFHSYRQPILIVFSHDLKRASSHPTPPIRRSLQSPNFQSISTNQNPAIKPELQEVSLRNARSAAVPTTGDCARHELRVDFEKLGWSNWIISPKWYDAYVCAGACAFPLGQNQRPTNHATVQSIVHELGLTAGVGTPSCVPTELHSVSLLYFDEHMNVVLKQYEDMIATSCGCQ